MNEWARNAVAILLGIFVAWLVNRLGIVWMHATLFGNPAFEDGCALFLTQAVPGLLGGLSVGFLAREKGLYVAAVAFFLWAVAGWLHPFWSIPLVAPQSAHSGLMHYFLFNPLVVFSFGSLGGWLGGQFATGRFQLADPEPVHMPGLEE